MKSQRMLCLGSVVLMAWVGACAPATPMVAFGGACTDDAVCAEGTCDRSSGAGFCTTTCTTAPCPATTSGSFVCGPGGVCMRACTEGTTRGAGAATELCRAGVFAACSGLDEATTCQACGCEPFGGGICTPGVGCEVPLMNGASCMRDGQCASGVCYRDTHVCGAKRALRAACSADVECESANCSTNGDETMVGRCNVRFGQACRLEDPCDDCRDIDVILHTGRCFRRTCNPANALCGRIDIAQFDCVESTDGMFRCYQQCSMETGCYYGRCSGPTDRYCD